MSQQHVLFTLTLLASAAVTAQRFVKADGAQAGAGEGTLGVAEYGVADTEAYPVNVLGTAVIEVGAAVAVDDSIESDASGRAITRTTGTIVAKALEAASAAGDKIEVLLIAN